MSIYCIFEMQFILDNLEKIRQGSQSGGNYSNDYSKYIKYKQKYLQLKNKHL